MGGKPESIETKELAHEDKYATNPRTVGVLVEKSRKKQFEWSKCFETREELGERRKTATTTATHERTCAQRNRLDAPGGGLPRALATFSMEAARARGGLGPMSGLEWSPCDDLALGP